MQSFHHICIDPFMIYFAKKLFELIESSNRYKENKSQQNYFSQNKQSEQMFSFSYYFPQVSLLSNYESHNLFNYIHID